MLTNDESRYFEEQLAFHETNYLAGSNPRQQSGFGRDERDWERFRRPVAAPMDKDGTFLDVGCANGLLMESVVAWANQDGHRIEPYGLDISERLADLARWRLPQWRDRIFVGNALFWDPPRQFDYVRTEMVYVPANLRHAYVERLLERFVTPEGRLLVCAYGSSRPEGERAELLVEELSECGVPIAGVYDATSPEHGFVITRVVAVAKGHITWRRAVMKGAFSTRVTCRCDGRNGTMCSEGGYRGKRLALARIACEEGCLQLAGGENHAGEAIEKYLAVFRDAFNRHGGCTTYSDIRVGYPWCCAFVYYCCLRAGFTFPPKPIPEHRWTLGAVPVWHDWAMLPENDFYFPANDCEKTPEAGDIVLFNRLLDDTDLDHIGIVVAVNASMITTAEGNVHNRSGMFERPRTDNINGYIRLTKF